MEDEKTYLEELECVYDELIDYLHHYENKLGAVQYADLRIIKDKVTSIVIDMRHRQEHMNQMINQFKKVMK